MEQFLEDYTTNVNPSYDYESKAKYQRSLRVSEGCSCFWEVY